MIIIPEAEQVLYKKIQKLRKQRERISEQISKTQSLLELICTHSDREEKEEYEEGSYYNKSEYVTYNVCKICGHKLLVSRTIGSYV